MTTPSRPRIGAVNYLNTKPLIYGFETGGLEREVIGGDASGQNAQLLLDLPSRLADSLADGRLDVALIPSIEFFRDPSYEIVSDACIACRGPVLSVKLLFRVPPGEVRRLALDEGSRTSVALAQILLKQMHGVSPQLESLPIGAEAQQTEADAVLLIGDRAIQPAGGIFVEEWDLGERWCQWTGLPFVFAMWVARPGADIARLSDLLSQSRDAGLAHLKTIAATEAPALGITPEVAHGYLRDNLHFTLGTQELQGLRQYYQRCVAQGWVAEGLESRIKGEKPLISL